MLYTLSARLYFAEDHRMDDQALRTFFKFDKFDLAANGKGSDVYLHIKGQTWEIDQGFADAIDGRNASAMVIGGRNGNNL